MKLIILVLCSRNYLSYISSKTQKKIWSSESENIKIIHFVGSYDEYNREANYITKENKDYLFLETDDRYENIAKKTIMAFEKIYEDFDFDFVFRTNTSSYINLPRFSEYVKNFESKLSYAGAHVNTKEGNLIASGAGIFLSKENVKLLIDNKNKIDFNLPDDVAIAKMLLSSKILPTNIERKDLKYVPTPIEIINDKNFHYRCRLDPQYHRILETALMRYLSNIKSRVSLKIYLNFIYLKILFYVSNIKFIRKLIQKYYSFKFYGEIYFYKKLIFKK